MRPSALLAVVLLLSSFGAAAAFRPELGGLDRVPLQLAPAADVQKALASAADDKSRPLQFAVGVPLALELAQGLWEQSADGNWRWRAQLRSVGALSLNLEFSQAEIPAGAALWLYTPDGRVAQGPYTAAGRDAQGRLWTAIVPGDTAVIEVQVPDAQLGQLRLQLAGVNHGFRDFLGTAAQAKAAGQSGDCNIDVSCEAGAAWLDEIRAETLVQIQGRGQCSGTLLNNTAGNDRALLLTARHCGIQSGNIGSVFAYFNFQRERCNGPDNVVLTQNLPARAHLVTHVEADTTLIELDPGTAPQDLETYGAFLAGWNAGTPAAASQGSPGAGIHHPSGDYKKISLYSQPLESRDNVTIGAPPNTFAVNAWRVLWAQGTTEQGSSGSALYDAGHRIVGVLSGGGASCDTPGEADFYGRLDVAYSALRPFLDPAGSNTSSLPGKNVAEGGGTTTGGTTTGTPPPASNFGDGGGGGGGFSWLLLAGIGLLAAWRRR